MRVPASPQFRRLLSAAVVSQLGDWSARLALAALLFEATDDPIWVGAVSAAFIAPWVVIGQLLTSWAERFGRQRVMVVGDAIRAAVFLFIALVDMPPGLVLASVFVAATVDPVFEANASATVYGSLPTDERDEGLRVKQVFNLSAQVAGFAAAGVALRWFSPQTVILVNAASFALSSLLVASARLTAEARGDHDTPARVRDAFRSAFSHAHIRAALFTTMITVFAATTVEAQIVVLSDPHPSWVLPVASAVVPLAAAVAAGTAPTEGGTGGVLRRTLIMTSLAAFACATMLLTDTAWGVVVAALCAGLMFQTTTSGQVIAFRHLPSEGRASVINILQTMVFIAISAGGLFSGVAIALWGTDVGLAICLAVTGLAWVVPLPGGPRHAREPVPWSRGSYA